MIISKVTAPQDAHKQFSAAGFSCSNTLEFSGTLVVGFSKIQFIAIYEQHKTCGSAPSMLLCDHIRQLRCEVSTKVSTTYLKTLSNENMQFTVI